MVNPYPWIDLSHIPKAGRYNPPIEYGNDIDMPLHTPITTPVAGTVVGSGYYAGGGVVTISGVVEGQPTYVYFQHLDLAYPGVGTVLREGDLIGLSGGQLSGGFHNVKNTSTKVFSTGPHVEVGFNAPYGGIWGKNPPGPNRDSYNWLRAVAGGGTGQPVVDYGTAAAQAATRVGLQRPNLHIGPDASVTQVLVGLDALLQVVNPFVVTKPDGSALDTVSIAGFNTGVDNPSEWITAVGSNLGADVFALIVRPLMIILGAFIFIKLIDTFINVQAAADTTFSVARLGILLGGK